ncbi:uncharacterized protein MELLADRAFT_86891 [Melampsora larici-populina 98AG31]|uniref:Uncharacterized protein n=1 Tax=Melampsora larici-populina (strain 98AG31 / pathotype 3-4-7) TaxID=747676 RepID=F4R3S1_MELLP|nr:uncharacterized protein MELLADRAFT_86891 [Melampsora larici-populina 98AG31]EGG13119.1 hypothetical protein MELLADRAFT_86891 [Melampsora larici-populina 98AG31]
MSTENDNTTTNTEKFNAMMRRSSDRLRGGSVPPLDSEQTINPPIETDQSNPSSTTGSQRGRGRGRGRRNARGSTRPGNGTGPVGEGTPAVTLTAPETGDNTNTSRPSSLSAPNNKGGPNATNSLTPNGAPAQGTTGTTVIHPSGNGPSGLGGLISKDNVSNATIVKPQMSQTSPRRENTTAVGVSPPRGFHSWLLANGLAVVSNPDTTTTVAQGATATLGYIPRSVTARQQTLTTRPNQPTEKPTETVPRTVICLDGTDGIDKVAPASTTESDSSKTVATTKPEVGEKGIENTGLVALLKHWADKIKPLDGYIPLSIMNVNWLKQDLIKISSRPKGPDDKKDKYYGLGVPIEWKMSFGEWVTAFDLFVAYLYYYKHDDLADKFKIHKENVFAIKWERLCWPMAFRYDMAIRTTVLTIRNADGKLANPAERNESIERDARLDSERLGNFHPRFADINPYADGQCKAFINPISGEPLRANQNSFQSNLNENFGVNHASKPNARSWAFANQVSYDGPGSVNYHNGSDDRYGSRGNRGRGRGNGWPSNGGGNREDYPRGRRGGDGYEDRRAEASGSWKRDDRREDRRNDDCEPNGPRYGGRGKANTVV